MRSRWKHNILQRRKPSSIPQMMTALLVPRRQHRGLNGHHRNVMRSYSDIIFINLDRISANCIPYLPRFPSSSMFSTKMSMSLLQSSICRLFENWQKVQGVVTVVYYLRQMKRCYFQFTMRLSHPWKTMMYVLLVSFT